MQILQITPKLPHPPKDGGAIAMISLARELANQGHKVTNLSINTPKHFFEIKNIPEKLRKSINFKSVYINTNINPINLFKNLFFSSLPYIAERFYSKKFQKELANLLKKEKFDIIQLEGIYLSMYIPFIKKHTKSPIALRAHNVEHEIWKKNAKAEKNLLKKWYMRNLSARIKKFERNIINQYDLLVPITNNDACFFNNNGNHKPYLVIPFGIDLSQYPIESNEGDIHKLFFIGSLDWLPNQEGILWFLNNPWNKIKKEYPLTEFHIAGRNAPGHLIEKLKNYNVEFHGEVEDIRSFVKDKSVMIVPLFSGSGMRVKIIEGIALGKIIITTSLGMEGIPAEDNIHLLVADSDEDFYNAIEKLHDDIDLSKNIKNNSIELLRKKFNNFAFSAELIKFYEANIPNC
ncbi:MAG: glycosyltransferase family 4 protein [Bacteroidota bacterium]